MVIVGPPRHLGMALESARRARSLAASEHFAVSALAQSVVCPDFV